MLKTEKQLNRGYRLHSYGGPDSIKLDDFALPKLGPGQVLVEVQAAGVNQFDWKLREGYMQQFWKLDLPVTLGVEFAGIVVDCAADAKRFKEGTKVMGLSQELGAYARYIAMDEKKLATVPAMSIVQAAALPIATSTAWHALHAAGELREGMRILIHAASGTVGSYAVQYAKKAGAYMIATASGANHDYVKQLGADEVIDYKKEKFEDKAKNIDLVLDLVGNDTTDRSWSVLAENGVLVSVQNPIIDQAAPPGKRGIFAMAQPVPAIIEKAAQDVVDGKLRSQALEVFDFSDYPKALDLNQKGHKPAKIVLEFKAKEFAQ